MFLFGVAGLLAGCGGDKVDSKQPKLVGQPDPRIQGPAAVGGAGGGSKPANQPSKAGIN
jgi:hypothetical protein